MHKKGLLIYILKMKAFIAMKIHYAIKDECFIYIYTCIYYRCLDLKEKSTQERSMFQDKGLKDCVQVYIYTNKKH